MAKYFYISAAGNYQITTSAARLRQILGSSGTAVTVGAYNTPNATVSTATTIIYPGAVSVSNFRDLLMPSSTGVWFDQGLYIAVTGTSPAVTILYD